MTREPERPIAGGNLGDDQDYGGLPDEEVRRAVLEHLQVDQAVDATGIGLDLAANALWVETTAREGAGAVEAPMPEALAATEPAHGVAHEDAPRATGPKRRGRRPPRLEGAVARTIREAPEGQARQMAAESASAFKERMRAVAEERDRKAGERARGAGEPGGRAGRGRGGRGEP